MRRRIQVASAVLLALVCTILVWLRKRPRLLVALPIVLDTHAIIGSDAPFESAAASEAAELWPEHVLSSAAAHSDAAIRQAADADQPLIDSVTARHNWELASRLAAKVTSPIPRDGATSADGSTAIDHRTSAARPRDNPLKRGSPMSAHGIQFAEHAVQERQSNATVHHELGRGNAAKSDIVLSAAAMSGMVSSDAAMSAMMPSDILERLTAAAGTAAYGTLPDATPWPSPASVSALLAASVRAGVEEVQSLDYAGGALMVASTRQNGRECSSRERCAGQTGPCEFCGAGLCCREGSTSDHALCVHATGGASRHRCSVATAEAAEWTLAELSNLSATSYKLSNVSAASDVLGAYSSDRAAASGRGPFWMPSGRLRLGRRQHSDQADGKPWWWSTGRLRAWRGGDVESPGTLDAALAARSWRGEIVLTCTDLERAAEAANLVLSLRAVGIEHSLVITPHDQLCFALAHSPQRLSCATTSWHDTSCTYPDWRRTLRHTCHRYALAALSRRLNVLVLDSTGVTATASPMLALGRQPSASVLYTLDRAPTCDGTFAQVLYARGENASTATLARSLLIESMRLGRAACEAASLSKPLSASVTHTGRAEEKAASARRADASQMAAEGGCHAAGALVRARASERASQRASFVRSLEAAPAASIAPAGLVNRWSAGPWLDRLPTGSASQASSEVLGGPGVGSEVWGPRPPPLVLVDGTTRERRLELMQVHTTATT